MSIEMMNLVMLARIEEPNIKFVLLMYANHANEDGENIYPAIKTVARNTSYSERTVQRITKELVENYRYLLSDGQGPKGTNKWRMNVDLLWSLVNPDDLPKGMMRRLFEAWTARQEGGGNLSGGDIPARVGDILSGGGVNLSSGGDMDVTRTIKNHHEPIKKPVSPGGSTEVFLKNGGKEKINPSDRESAPEVEPSSGGVAPGSIDPKVAMEKMLTVWRGYFPEKNQPAPEKYLLLLKERIAADPDFCIDWMAATRKAAQSKFLHQIGWFQFPWLLKNGENVLKVSDGVFDGFDKKIAEEDAKKDREAGRGTWIDITLEFLREEGMLPNSLPVERK